MSGALVAKGEVIDFEAARWARERSRMPAAEREAVSRVEALKERMAHHETLRAAGQRPRRSLGSFAMRRPLLTGTLLMGGLMAPSLALEHHERKQDRLSRERIARRTNRGAAAVGKRLVDEEKRTSPIRLVGATAGMSAVAWGGSRSRMLGVGLRAASHSPDVEIGVRRALAVAEKTRQGIEHATSPLGRVTGRGIGRMPRPLREALEGVPRGLRPATATLAGAILVDRSRPVRRNTYTPVVMG